MITRALPVTEIKPRNVDNVLEQHVTQMSLRSYGNTGSAVTPPSQPSVARFCPTRSSASNRPNFSQCELEESVFGEIIKTLGSSPYVSARISTTFASRCDR